MTILLNALYIFCIFNDNFMVDCTGVGSILKLVIALFILANIPKFLSFPINRLQPQLVYFFLFWAALSFLLNFSSYHQPAVPVSLLIAALAIFVIVSQANPEETIRAAWYSIAFSIAYAFFRPDTISQWTFRKTGGVGDPNEFAVHCLMMLFIGQAYARQTQSAIIAYSTPLLVMTGLLLASSISSILALAGVLGVTVVLRFPVIAPLNRKRNTPRWVPLALLSILGVVVLCIPAAQEKITNQFEKVSQRATDNTGNAHSRITAWKSGYLMTAANPIFGVGPHRYMFAAPDYGTGWYLDPASAEAHNLFIKAVAETGIPGLALLMAIVALSLYRTFHPTQRELRVYGFILLCPVVMGMTLSLTFAKYFWLALALANHITPPKEARTCH